MKTNFLHRSLICKKANRIEWVIDQTWTCAADKRFTLIQSKRNVSLVTDSSHTKESLVENDDLCDVITLGQVESHQDGGGDQKVTCNGVPGKEEFVYDIYCLQDQPIQNTSFSEQDWKDVKAYFDELEDEDDSGDNLQSDSEDSNAGMSTHKNIWDFSG